MLYKGSQAAITLLRIPALWGVAFAKHCVYMDTQDFFGLSAKISTSCHPPYALLWPQPQREDLGRMTKLSPLRQGHSAYGKSVRFKPAF